MNNISQLSNIVMPDPVSWWPFATGWYLLIFLFLLVVIILSVKRYRQWLGNQYRRDAIALIAPLQLASAHQLYPLIKRVSQVTDKNAGDEEPERWFALMQASTAVPLFTEAELRQVYQCGYQNPEKSLLSEVEFSALKRLCQRWIQEHQSHKGAAK